MTVDEFIKCLQENRSSFVHSRIKMRDTKEYMIEDFVPNPLTYDEVLQELSEQDKKIVNGENQEALYIKCYTPDTDIYVNADFVNEVLVVERKWS